MSSSRRECYETLSRVMSDMWISSVLGPGMGECLHLKVWPSLSYKILCCPMDGPMDGDECWCSGPSPCDSTQSTLCFIRNIGYFNMKGHHLMCWFMYRAASSCHTVSYQAAQLSYSDNLCVQVCKYLIFPITTRCNSLPLYVAHHITCPLISVPLLLFTAVGPKLIQVGLETSVVYDMLIFQ